MHTTGPTAGAAHPAFKFRERLLDADIPCLRFLARYDPANPLIAREWRNVFPYC